MGFAFLIEHQRNATTHQFNGRYRLRTAFTGTFFFDRRLHRCFTHARTTLARRYSAVYCYLHLVFFCFSLCKSMATVVASRCDTTAICQRLCLCHRDLACNAHSPLITESIHHAHDLAWVIVGVLLMRFVRHL